jgi:3-hydroxypropanoate dehydrogenase
MKSPVMAESLDQIFRSAHTYNGWIRSPVGESEVRDLYDLLKWGPTSANCCPGRFVWVRSEEGKAKLAALAFEKNRPKILAAPLTVIIGNDVGFADALPKLMPHNTEAMQKPSPRRVWLNRPPRVMAVSRAPISSSRRAR